MRPNDFDVMTIGDFRTAWEELHCSVSHMRSECKYESVKTEVIDEILEKMNTLEKLNLISVDHIPVSEVKTSEPPTCQAW